ncbi:MAG: MFS transporter [Nitrososphaeria archaeon]
MLKKRILISALIIMLFNSVYQYSWNVFALYLAHYYGLSVMVTEAMFYVFVFMSTFLQILGGYISDIKGPRLVGIIAAVLSAAGYIAFMRGVDLPLRFLLWAGGSAGEGILYGIATNSALKWHKENRGLAVGIVSLGFGAGATIFNPVFLGIHSLQQISIIMFVLEIIILPLLVMNLSYPEKLSGKRPREAVFTLPFILIYLSYSLGTVPLISLSSSLFILRSGYSLLVAIILFPLMSGLGRPFMGRFSDRIGRIKTIFLSLFILIISGILGVFNTPLLPEILIGFLGGSLIPLFFALVGDYMGEAYSASLTSILYTGKSIGGLIGSIGIGYVSEKSVIYGWILMVISSLLSLFFLFILFKLDNKRKA